MKHTLEADSIRLLYDGRTVLSDVYIKCETGRVTGLVGRNGQGKSSLMKILFGSMSVEQSVRFDGKPHPKAAFKTTGLMRYLPQRSFVPPFVTLERLFIDFDVDLAAFVKRSPQFSGSRDKRLGDFSGGERRWIEVYVIVKSASRFVLLDEPFTHLAPLQIEEAKALIREEKSNKGFLISDHLFEHVFEITDDLYVLKDGKTHPVRNADQFEALGYLPPATPDTSELSAG